MNTRTPPHLQMHACQLLQGTFRARGKGADERKQYEVSKSQEGCKHLSRPFSFVIVSSKTKTKGYTSYPGLCETSFCRCETSRGQVVSVWKLTRVKV